MSPASKRQSRGLLRLCALAGFDPRLLFVNLKSLPGFIGDLRRYAAVNDRPAFRITLRDIYPILNERTAGAGTVGGPYFHQDLWAARKIFQRRPIQHLDIGSRIDGFVAHLLVFMPVILVDIRAIESSIEGLSFIQSDATELANLADNSVDSLSSLHAAEHFGLGRYSDPIDPNACFRFMGALQRVLAPAGRLYFSVPIGRERLNFNAHRVFKIDTILSAFSSLELKSFSFVDDDGRLHDNVNWVNAPVSEHGCGLFEFTKPD